MVAAVRPRTRELVRSAYRLVAVPPAAEDPVEIEPGLIVPRYIAAGAESGAREAELFFARLPESVVLSGRSVLDVACGAGDLCVAAARRGAARGASSASTSASLA